MATLVPATGAAGHHLDGYDRVNLIPNAAGNATVEVRADTVGKRCWVVNTDPGAVIETSSTVWVVTINTAGGVQRQVNGAAIAAHSGTDAFITRHVEADLTGFRAGGSWPITVAGVAGGPPVVDSPVLMPPPTVTTATNAGVVTGDISFEDGCCMYQTDWYQMRARVAAYPQGGRLGFPRRPAQAAGATITRVIIFGDFEVVGETPFGVGPGRFWAPSWRMSAPPITDDPLWYGAFTDVAAGRPPPADGEDPWWGFKGNLVLKAFQNFPRTLEFADA